MYTNQQFGSSVCCLGETRTAKGLGLFRSRQNGNPSPGLRRLRHRVLKALGEDLQNPYARVRIPPSPQHKDLEKRAHAPHAFFSITAKGSETLSRRRALSPRKNTSEHQATSGNATKDKTQLSTTRRPLPSRRIQFAARAADLTISLRVGWMWMDFDKGSTLPWSYMAATIS